MTEKLRSKFIVLDGPDGCGKSTQARMLAEWLQSNGVAVASFRDPGGTAIGEKIRQILLSPEHIAMSVRTELLLHMAARAQLWEENIRPALLSNKCVVLDRWLSSTCAYQGFAGGFGIENVIKLAEHCLERPWPDLTVILDIDVETSASRLGRKLDRMEQKGCKYHEKVREGFLKLAEQKKELLMIDAAGDIENIHERIKRIIMETYF